MPIAFLGRLAAPQRTRTTTRQLGGILAFVAGAVNAGGFLAVARYTSHMTGILSAIADDLVLGHLTAMVGGIALVATFVLGALATAILTNFARRHGLHGEYALPLMVEAALLLVLGLLGANYRVLGELVVPTAVLLLCFIMGLQNAVITKVSSAEIRTTHMTGIATDLGIELGKLVYRNHDAGRHAMHFVRSDRDKLRIHAAMLALFVTGGIVGAFSFRQFGFSAILPFAAILMLIAAPPLSRDVLARRR